MFGLFWLDNDGADVLSRLVEVSVGVEEDAGFVELV